MATTRRDFLIGGLKAFAAATFAAAIEWMPAPQASKIQHEWTLDCRDFLFIDSRGRHHELFDRYRAIPR